jgi:TRAP-type C4-dicarboxylate transport system permease small subunit
MANQKLIGILLLTFGLILLFFGWQSTESVGEQLTEAVTGRFTQQTMLYLIGGAIAAIAGLYILLSRR